MATRTELSKKQEGSEQLASTVLCAVRMYKNEVVDAAFQSAVTRSGADLNIHSEIHIKRQVRY